MKLIEFPKGGIAVILNEASIPERQMKGQAACYIAIEPGEFFEISSAETEARGVIVFCVKDALCRPISFRPLHDHDSVGQSFRIVD